MTEHATPTFGIEAWDEHPTWEGDDGRRVTRATVTKRYHGELDATGVMEYVMAYAPDGSAIYVGLERVDGRLGNRTGSFVLQDAGRFVDGVAVSTFVIVEGSGTGELAGIRGTARVDATKADTQTMQLTFELDAIGA